MGLLGIHAGREHAWMPRFVTDAFGLVTVSLIFIFAILGVLCIVYSVYFRSRIQNQGLSVSDSITRRLGYFNGPWIIRIVLIVVAIWWGFGEVIRLSLLKGDGRLFTKPAWQKGVCKFYIISNIGFAEPSLLLLIVYLLHASLQKREHGALNHGWNMKAAGYTFLLCLPMFLVQLTLVLIEPMISNKKHGTEMKIQKYFTSSTTSTSIKSSLTGTEEVYTYTTCTYPLINTVVLGFFDSVLVIYISCLGYGMVSSVINKGLERRIYFLLFSVVSFFPLRVFLLGFSILPDPGSLVYEAIVFLAFLMLLLCALVGVCMLVYYPVADSLALRNLRRYMELEDISVHDDIITYYT